MDIYARPGTKVKFLGKNGYDYQLKEASEMFEVGLVLTVKSIEVGDSSSSVVFEEMPGKSFNTVMFEEVYFHEHNIRNALSLLRLARNNMPKSDFLKTVREYTEDANVAMPLLEAASVVSYERIAKNAVSYK